MMVAETSFSPTALERYPSQVTSPLALFHSVVGEAARSVPAYRAFLRQHAPALDPGSIQTLDDFRTLPLTTKENYHRAFPLSDLCRGGRLPAAHHLAVSSGSTGEPCIWPRRLGDEEGTTRRFEQVLVGTFGASQKATLGVVCFALGNWVGGMYTTAACRRLADPGRGGRGLPLTLATPGNNIAEILRVVRAVGASFEQVVLFGYPPFLRDVLEAGTAAGIAWGRLRTKLVGAGEVFDEGWRSRVCEQLGAADPALSVASLYGTADGGVLANETAPSVRIRRALATRPELVQALFGQSRLPTLCQFDPEHRYLEAVDGRIVISADGLLPLLRYDILDQGGVISAQQMAAFLRQHGLAALAAELDGPDRLLPTAAEPFVYVFGRSGFALSLYGANVYPENIAPALHRPEFAGQVTGKFVMELVDDGGAPRLSVTIELARGGATASPVATPALASQLGDAIEAELVALNSEYTNYVPAARRAPVVVLRDFGDPRDFPPGAKHRYTRN